MLNPSVLMQPVSFAILQWFLDAMPT